LHATPAATPVLGLYGLIQRTGIPMPHNGALTPATREDRVRIDPPHPLVYRERRLNGAVLRIRQEKPRPRVTAGVVR
jgi:hypothetical protein